MGAMGRRAVLVVVLAFALAACAKQRVVTQPDLPPLAPPPPPARVVAPPDTEEPPPETSPEPDRKPARRVAPKNDNTQNPPRVEPPKRDTPPKPDTPMPPVDPVPPTTLQTAKPATQAEMERQSRSLLAQAAHDLGRVHYGGLNVDGKSQYDTAKRFIEQAQQSLKEQNFVLARALADKAATIAGVLVGR
jgi:outer membrane biosynthesis protein TonB